MNPYTQMLASCKYDLGEHLTRDADGEWIMSDAQYDGLTVAVGNADGETIANWIMAMLLRVGDLEDERAANELHRTHQEKCAADSDAKIAELTTRVESLTADVDEMESAIENYQAQLLTIRDSIQAMRRAINNNRGFVALTPEQFNIITAQLQIVYELAVD